MILKPEIRSQFTVFLFFQDLEMGTKLRTALSLEGYESFAFMDYETLLHRIRESSPHIIIFNLEALMGTLSEFVEQVLKINPEISFLPLLDAHEASALDAYREYNFTGFLPTGEGLEVRLRWSVEQICSELFLTYQNEGLLESGSDAKMDIEQMKAEVKAKTQQIVDLEERLRSVNVPESFSARECAKAYAGLANKEEMFPIFLGRLQRVQNLTVLFLKYLPSVHNLVATQVLNLEIEKLKGIGAKLKPAEVQNLANSFMQDEIPGSVRELMTKGLHTEKFISRGLMVHRGVEGLFLFWRPDTGESAVAPTSNMPISLIDNEFAVFSQAYFASDLAKRFDAINFEDAITETYNREFYFTTLEEEVARSRRLQRAVSIVKISFDHWEQIARQGQIVQDSVLRSLAALMKKTSRVNDMVCRTKDNEFSLVLPHTARKGAAIRAERMRRMVETQSFQYSDRSLTVSCGVSEYPTFCSSAAELDQTASQALGYIQTRGGNKVCLFRPNNSFKPDFDVPPI